MREEVAWWMAASDQDLQGARRLLEADLWNLASFHAQQAAEKALKAALLARGHFERGHASIGLLEELAKRGVPVPEELKTVARKLDKHYVDARYPNGAGGDPARFYDEPIAREAVSQAEELVRHARSLL